MGVRLRHAPCGAPWPPWSGSGSSSARRCRARLTSAPPKGCTASRSCSGSRPSSWRCSNGSTPRPCGPVGPVQRLGAPHHTTPHPAPSAPSRPSVSLPVHPARGPAPLLTRRETQVEAVPLGEQPDSPLEAALACWSKALEGGRRERRRAAEGQRATSALRFRWVQCGR